jgi:hypothetical protein
MSFMLWYARSTDGTYRNMRITPVIVRIKNRTHVMVPNQKVVARLRLLVVTYAGKTWKRKFLTTESEASRADCGE